MMYITIGINLDTYIPLLKNILPEKSTKLKKYLLR